MMGGRSLPHAILMMIPEPWQNHESMDPARRAFYDYHSSLMEPWDGPASIAFTDGSLIGAVLDRNGLRPSRYYVTKDDLVIMASEVGVLDVAPENIRLKERLHPGKVFLVDTVKGRIVDDEEIKSQLAAERPYQRWLAEHLIDIEDLPDAARLPEPDHHTVLKRQQAFGYTEEDLRILLAPMAANAEEALGSMGTDTALAVLSTAPARAVRLLQAAVRAGDQSAARRDPRGADHVDGVDDRPRGQSPRSASRVVPADRRQESGDQQRRARQAALRRPRDGRRACSSPIRIRATRSSRQCPMPAAVPGFRTVTLPMLFDPKEDGPGLAAAMDALCRQASEAVAAGYNILILSDRGINERKAAIPSLLATAGVHHHLVREGTRTKCALVVEAGDAREVHHCALLIGYGAGAVNPYLAFETFDDMIRQGMLPGLTHAKAVRNYIKALNKGILKVMSKMGISTLASYCGAQIFEAIGLSQAFVDRYFTNTPSRIEGVGIEVIAEEVAKRHQLAFPTRPVNVARARRRRRIPVAA